MMTKIKALLVSFGYRKVDETMYLKPIGFVGMVARINNEELTLFSSFFNKNGKLVTWNSKSLNISELTEMELEEASYKFALAEEEIFHKVYGGKPFNSITAQEVVMVREGIL